MAKQLILNGVKQSGCPNWTNQNSQQSGATYAGESADIKWNQSGYLQITTFINGYKSNLSGFSTAFNASAYHHVYVECKTDGLNSGYGNARLVVTAFGSQDNTGIQRAMTNPSTLTEYKIDLSSLASKNSLQVYLYYRDYRTGNAVMDRAAYIKNLRFTSDYTIEYDANGGSGEPSDQTFEEGTRTLSSTVPTRNGYSFLGWSKSSSATSATYAAGGSIDLTGNVKLYAVWKAQLSTVSASNGTIGTSQNITITQQGSSFSYNHTLKYSVTGNNGTASGTIVTGKTGSSATITQAWTPPSSIVSKVTNSKTCTCVITCETYSGSTLLGSKTTTITLTIPNTYAPSFTTNSIERTPGTFPVGFSDWVSGKTTPVFTGTVNVKNDASVVSWKFTVNGVTTAVSSSDVTKTWTGAAVTTGTLTMTVTDSRGYTCSYSITPTIAAYSAPDISGLIMARALQDGTINEQGQYLRTEGTITWSDLDGTNALSYAIEYMATGGTWVEDESGSVTASAFAKTSTTAIMNESTSYDVRVVLTDFDGDHIFSSTVSTALSIIDIKANGLGVAFGKVHTEADNSVVVAYPWSLIRPVSGIGDEIINGFLTLNSGTTAGASTTLPSYGTWLVFTAHASTAANNGIWIVRSASGTAAAHNMCGGSGITLTIADKTITVKTASNTALVYAIKISAKT